MGTSLAGWTAAAGGRLGSTARRGEAGALATAGEDLLLIAVPDPVLPEVAAELARGRRGQAAVVLHTSGSQDAAVLAPLREAGSAIGSLHPLKAFPRPLPDPGEARGVFFAVDGDPAAVALAHRLATAWGGTSAEVAPAARPLYHLLASVAAGGVVTLLSAVEELAGRLGLPPAVVGGYLELARGAVAAAAEAHAAGSPVPAALTGPVARGDSVTVARQLTMLEETASGPGGRDTLDLIVRLARETRRQRERAGGVTGELRERLRELEAELARWAREANGGPR